ncbi:MAG: hypothetical protein IRZ16_12655 [Myxococcaceae bacterium]|nr:hypothetical protein [Myxococcaceae bacterium]
MKFLCASCERQAAASSFRVEGDRLWLTCAHCGAEGTLELAGNSTPEPRPSASPPAPAAPSAPPSKPPADPPANSAARVIPLRAVEDAVQLAAEAAASDDPFAVPADRCPKCIGVRRPESETCPHCGLTFVNFRPEEVLPSAEVAEAFRTALAAWDDESRHEALVRLARERGELAAVGRLYRIRSVVAPMDPIAQRGREEILRRATAAGEALRGARTAAPGRIPLWQIVAAAIMLIGALMALALMVRQLA